MLRLMLGSLLLSTNLLAAPLDAFKWQQRLLMVVVTEQTRLQQLTELYSQHQADFASRKLNLIMVQGNALRCVPVQCQPNTAGDLVERLTLTNHQAVLIGLDGGVKQRFSLNPLQLPAVFAAIDQMPIRQRELRAIPLPQQRGQ